MRLMIIDLALKQLGNSYESLSEWRIVFSADFFYCSLKSDSNGDYSPIEQTFSILTESITENLEVLILCK